MTTASGADARERLLAAALAIAVAEGADAVTTRAVCAEAGVQAPTLYHHFGDRAGLLRAVVDRAFDDYFAAKERAEPPGLTTAEEQIGAGWDAHVEFARTHAGLYPAMYPIAGPPSAQLERSGALLRAGFDRLEREGALASGITPALATSALRSALRGVAHVVAAAPTSVENGRISAIVRDAVISGLLAPDRRTMTND
jgi:AcrR family transcriptional regulator